MKRTLVLAAVLCLLAVAAAGEVRGESREAGAQSAAAADRQSAVVGLRSPVTGAEAITIPQLLSYQGRLTDTLGVPVPDGNYALTFRLYTQPTAVGPVSSPETDERILAIRGRQRAALACGDRAELKRLEGEAQAIHLQSQAVSPAPGYTVRGSGPRPGLGRFAGPDAEIDTGRFISTAADYTSDGNMYVAAFRLGDSMLHIYRSSDHGSSWHELFGFTVSGPGGKLAIPRLGLSVGEGDSAFIHVFCVVPQPYDDAMLVRVKMDGSDFDVYNVWAGSDTITDLAVCRDYTGSNYWLYAVAVNGERVVARNARYLRSTDYGVNWAVTDSGSYDLHPHYSFGAGSWLYHALEGPDAFVKGEVWLFYNPLFGARGQWHMVVVKPDTFGVSDPVIAPAFTLPESSAAVWSVFSHDYQGVGDWDILFSSSTDGGRSWQGWDVLSANFDSLERFPDVRNYTSLGNTYINASYIWESDAQRVVYRHYANSPDPRDWSDTLRINTNSAGTGRALRPLLIYSPGGPGSGSGCVFVGAGLQGLYFNAPWLVGMAEVGSARLRPEEPSRLCRGVFEWSGSSSALLFDAFGRQAAKISPGTNDIRALPAGVYHLRSRAQGRTERLVLLP